MQNAQKTRGLLVIIAEQSVRERKNASQPGQRPRGHGGTDYAQATYFYFIFQEFSDIITHEKGASLKSATQDTNPHRAAST